MENSNRPVQRVTPIRSEYPNRVESNLNPQSSSSLSDFSLCNQNNLINNVNVQQFKINNNPNNTISNQNSNVLDSLPFLQQNVNIMNINLPNNAILQNVPQDSVSIQNVNFNQPLSNQKTLIQLSDGRFVQFAQNLQPAAQQMPTTILVQMPYKVFDQNLQKSNQNSINKKYLLPSKSVDKQPQNLKSFPLGSGNPLNMNTDLILAAPQVDQSQQQLINDYQRTMKDQLSLQNFDQKLNQNSILNVEKYQEICDILQNKKLLTKLNSNEETVLVEFRLNQQKYQLRMTRNQKVEMEKILVSVGNQQRQMEILQVYQAEQRKMMQQRTPVVLNQMINNKTTPNIVCNKPQIQGLNIAKQVYPLNSVLVAVPQNQFGDSNFVQTNSINQPKNIAIQPTASQATNGILLAARLPTSQQNILSPSPLTKDSSKDSLIRQKRNFKTPNTAGLNNAPNREFLPNANANNDMKPARSRRYNNMRKVLLDDHNSVLMPNCSTPFADINDAVQRLLPYHILEESKDQRMNEVERIINNSFTELDKKCANLKRISSALSMNKILCDKNSEDLIIKRMRLDLERDIFEHEKLLYINNDNNHKIKPLQFDEVGNAFPVAMESPTLHIISSDDETINPPKIEPQLPDNVFATCDTSFVESIEDNDAVDDSTDNLPDALCNYDIQDISVDSIDSPISECADWSTMHDVSSKEPLTNDVVANTQSEDPDLDAAIKSILY